MKIKQKRKNVDEGLILAYKSFEFLDLNLKS